MSQGDRQTRLVPGWRRSCDRRRPARRLAALGAAALLACAGTYGQFSSPNPVPSVRAGEWSQVRSLATRRADLYDRFSHRATVTATYMGVPERRAKVDRLAEWLGWTEPEKARRLETELAEAARYDDFVVALYTGDRRDNDLDARSSIWRVALTVDGAQLVSHDASALEVNATLASLFPYVSPFDVVYRVRFDKAPGAPLSERRFAVELASARGKLQLGFGDGAVGPDQPPGTPLPD